MRTREDVDERGGGLKGQRDCMRERERLGRQIRLETSGENVQEIREVFLFLFCLWGV